ncbi:MAG: alanine dehydrogenase [Candidatus Marinimicrobia bacterium]|nr:alanine dehydrogenase [Candidatus Neomarinimicrobiota bacterium]MCF7829961.1 alanine dehydrogenase [Candidatus Neomarinimicrobiota bacterium]MCF7881885.1 alanine dehydrogenase [Candidatus Neomarinimicrobiota bacterium]
MNIGIIRDHANQEHRVALTPSGVGSLHKNDHTIFLEEDAGIHCNFHNAYYEEAGATIVYSREEVFQRADLILKVSPLTIEDCGFLRREQIVFGFHHLAVESSEVIDALIEKRITAIGYEIIEDDHGDLPILTSMSEIAGQMSVHVGAHYLQNEQDGRGILFGGLPGVPEAAVVILGAGVVGLNATQSALGLGGHVVLLDSNVRKLRKAANLFGKRVTTALVNDRNLRKAVEFADVLIGAVLIHGDRTPHLVTREHVQSMKRRAVVVDVSIDQGGCVETSRPTSLANPSYTEEDVIHYCVPNMPSNVARTATYALTNASLPFITGIVDQGLNNMLERDNALRRGIYFYEGTCTRKRTAEQFDIEYRDIDNPFLRQ